MYYFIRLLIVILLFCLIIFIMVKSKKFIFFTKNTHPELYSKYCTDKKFRKSTIILNISISLIAPLLLLISSYPYEGHFITFETINDSLNYKNINTENIDIYDYDDCVFVVDNSEYDIYSVTKTNGRYKLVDFDSENIGYYQPHQVGNNGTTTPQVGKYNKETNKTFYYFGITGDEKPDDEDVTLDGNVMTYCKESKIEHLLKRFQQTCWIYSYLDNAEPKLEFIINSGECEVVIKDKYYLFKE